MTKKEQQQALKRLESYSSDMRNGLIDISGCVKLSTYSHLKKANKVQASLDSSPLRAKIKATASLRENKKKK